MQQDKEGECVLEIPHSIHDSVMTVVPLIRKLRTLVEEYMAPLSERGLLGAQPDPPTRDAAAAVAQVRGEVRHVGWCGSSARASPVCDAEG